MADGRRPTANRADGAQARSKRGGDSISVMVQYIVRVSELDRFVTTSEKFASMMEAMGGRNGGVHEDENDPGLVSTISEWESHDQMHEASAKYCDQFNEEAGTAACSGTPTSGIAREMPDRSHSRTRYSVNPRRGATRRSSSGALGASST